MDIWLTVILTIHVLVALSIIFLVLLQHGKGADMGAAFGSGSSGSLFGATGSANFLSRTTAALAAVFFLTSLGLAYVATHKPQTGGSVMQGVTAAPAVAPKSAEEVPKPADVPKPATAPSGSNAGDVPK
ncbi:MAG: preprotein translocase subunit SecG [Burkholderiales bacterium]|nr:preprotein translocase subunit SecG [Burkholderiales bacterium]